MIKNGKKNKLTVRVTGGYYQGEVTTPIVESNKEDTNPKVDIVKKEDGNFFKNMKKEGKTIICVTHDQEVANVADRIISLAKEE